MILVRNGDVLRNTFSSSASYLSRESDGMLAGDFWPCDYGLDLSRSCRAMKTWFTIKVSLEYHHFSSLCSSVPQTYGVERMGRIISNGCLLAEELKLLISKEVSLELLGPVTLNIVCFRFIGTILPAEGDLLDRYSRRSAETTAPLL
jgi:aromatic-L-amino-acid/L-tryptophan decarboxylase